MKKILLKLPSKYQEKLCDFFGNAVLSTNEDMYFKRNQENREKLLQDLINGKKAEYMMFNYLHSVGKKVSPPDIMVYQVQSKNFEADLLFGKIKIHVKSCLQESIFPISWVFQPEDELVKNPTSNDFLALVVMSDNPYCYLIAASEVKYGNPIKESLNKAVIYESDLK
ncbi:MAG: hypothetical protein HC836_49545 [Richelia sp. RM2_1_2]|nr:hypothetical protein [Richelia sp. RM2_1_2]